jgi:hypothetical protein
LDQVENWASGWKLLSLIWHISEAIDDTNGRDMRGSGDH